MQTYQWTDIPKEKISDQISRQMFWGEHIMATRWELGPGVFLPTHEHVSEQMTTVEEGSVTIHFSETESVTLKKGDLLLIASSKPHSVEVGRDGCLAVDYFSPIRQDFIEGRASYLTSSESKRSQGSPAEARPGSKEPYQKLQRLLHGVGIKADLETLLEVPIETLARYAYEKQCVTMGQLRDILNIDKNQARDLLRQWKHGDDHSEASYEKMLRTMVVVPGEPMPR